MGGTGREDLSGSRSRIVLLVVYTGALAVQLLVREVAPVGLAIRAYFLVDPGLLSFKLRGLASSQLPGFYAAGNPVLLVLAPHIYLVIAILLSS